MIALHWPLINEVRDHGYDCLTIEEKRRMHTLVVRYRRDGVVSAADLAWLQSMADALAGVAAMQKTFRPRRGR